MGANYYGFVALPRYRSNDTVLTPRMLESLDTSAVFFGSRVVYCLIDFVVQPGGRIGTIPKEFRVSSFTLSCEGFLDES